MTFYQWWGTYLDGIGANSDLIKYLPLHQGHNIPLEKLAAKSAWDTSQSDMKRISLALFDVLDGNSDASNIHCFTGLPIERCREISEIFKEILP